MRNYRIAVAMLLLLPACSCQAPRPGSTALRSAQRSPAVAALSAIWALDDGTKIKSTALDHPLERRNGVFDGQRVSLFAARNETVAFQLILEGGAAATPEVRVRLDGIGPIANGRLSRDPDNYFIARRIEVFEQRYVKVTERSHDLSWDPGTAAAPTALKGWIPDALVPLRPGQAFTVPRRRNRGLWFDVYVPKSTPTGLHRGTIEVTVGGRPCRLKGCRLPVQLRVLAATLPDVPTVKTMLYFSGGDDDRDQMLARYLEKPWDASDALADRVRHRHFKLARRHRITLFIGADKRPNASLARRLDGRAFNRAAGYEGPGEGIGQDLYSIHTYGGELTPERARRWATWLTRHGPSTRHFLYAADEPKRDDFDRINRIADAARPVPTFVTHDYAKALPSVSIFCALASDYRPSRARAAARAGRELWIYNGVRPFTGSFVIDDVAISPRVNPWLQYKYGVARWFYWESTYYKDEQGKRGQVNVFRDPINYSNRHGDRMNGDGLLIYPGRDLLFPAEDRRIDLPLPSIRLKNWRRGIQDVEYLVLARRAGHHAEVKKLVERMVPAALADETRPGRAVAWPEDGERWLRAREELAALFEHTKGKGTIGDGR